MTASHGQCRYSEFEVPIELAESARRRDLYSVDTYFREAWHDCLEEWRADAIGRTRSITFVVVKPDGIVGRKVEPILNFLTSHGLKLSSWALFTYTRHIIREAWRYQFNVATMARIAIVDILLLATPSLFLVFEGSDDNPVTPTAIRLSRLKGPVNSRERAAHHLRSVLESPAPLLNFVHTADEPADVVRELGVCFDVPERLRLLREVARSGDPSHSLLPVVTELYDRYPRHDLSLDKSLQRIEENCRRDISMRDTIVLEALGDCARIRGGEPVDWSILSRRLSAGNVETDLWDRIVVGASLTQCDVAGVEPLL